MRIVVIGASGTIGKAVVKSLSERHEVLQVTHSKGDYRVDIANKESVKRLFERLGPFDALVSTAGQAKFGSLETLADEDFQLSHRRSCSLLFWSESLPRVSRKMIVLIPTVVRQGLTP